MKKISRLLLIMMILFVILGCSNDKIRLPEPPKNLQYDAMSRIDGPLSDYIEVVPGQYKFEIEKREDDYSPNYNGKIFIKFKFKKPLSLNYDYYEGYGPSLFGKALNEKKMPLDFKLNIEIDKNLSSYLARGEGEEWLELKLYAQGLIKSEEDVIRILDEFEKDKYIRFDSQINQDSISNSENLTKKSVEKEELNECDEFLIGYENFMNKYIKAVKKYNENPSNQEIVNEYTKLMSSLSEWSNKAGKCKDDKEFIKKFSQIQIKIANVY